MKEMVILMDNYLNTLSPYIRIASDSKITPPHKIKRVIFDYELLFVKKGNVIITVGDSIYEGSAGDIFLLKPKEEHTIEVVGTEIFHQPHIHFDFNYEQNSPDVKISFQTLDNIPIHDYNLFRNDITKTSSIHIPNYIKLKNPEYFENMLFEIIKEYKAKLPYYEIKIKGIFVNLFTYLLRELFFETNTYISSNMKILFEMKNYITINSNREITLDELERTFSMSRYHIIRLFKDTYGMTPIHFHQLIRIEKAKEMIQFTDYSITEIADQFGFKSIHSFSRAFKKIDNVTPSFYRRR
ncbi:MAG: AraC family transcriptional regulator [Vallitalea sp.]|jgi:AraC-like DNA-binding protein|nr:AraC family transcriptional regulator [Vallitalea sp.]